MPIEQILGNLKDIVLDNFEIDYVDLEWFDAYKKIARWKTRNGDEITIRLKNPPRVGLSQGDILLKQEDENSSRVLGQAKIIAINILPAPTLCLKAKNPVEIAKICYEIGNRHAALFFGKNPFEFKTPFEMPLKTLFDKLHIKNIVVESRLDASTKISVNTINFKTHLKIKQSPDFTMNISKCQ